GDMSGDCPRTCRKGTCRGDCPGDTALADDAGAADDRVFAVREPDPGLALAVVVGAPDDERRVAAADLHSLGSLRSGAAPDAYERVLVPLAADRRLVGVPGQDAPL